MRSAILQPDLLTQSGPNGSYPYASTLHEHALKVEPFAPVSETSISTPSQPQGTMSSKAAQARQEFLTNQLRAVQHQLRALDGTSLGSVSSGPLSASSVPSENVPAAQTTDRAGLEQARQQNHALQERIRVLEGQLNSQWALGLSDDPPPGYIE